MLAQAYGKLDIIYLSGKRPNVFSVKSNYIQTAELEDLYGAALQQGS